MKFLLLLLKSKWEFKKIKKKKLLLVDGNFNPFLKYYRKQDFNIIHRRGEKINFRVLIKCIAELNITSLNYFKNFIECAKPKVILTGFDYHPIFYRLKNITKVKTFMLQKGKRTLSDGVFKKLILLKKNLDSKFFVDHIFLYNKLTCNNYKKILDGKFYSIGSFENNFTKIEKFNQKKEIVYISDYKIDDKGNLQERCENDEHVVANLHKLAIKKSVKFNILPRYKKLDDDKENKLEFYFYKKLLKKNFNFIKVGKKNSSYEIIRKYKYVFCTHSTLGVENLVKGGRTAFLFFKSKNNPTSNYRFGSLEKIPKRGLFWSSDNHFNLKELVRVFNFTFSSKEIFWKSIATKIGRKVIDYDYDNKKFRNLIEKEIKKKII